MHLDSVTQQNAALAEATATASECTVQQPVQLCRAVEVFKLSRPVA